MSEITLGEIQPQYCVNAKIRRIHRLLNTPYQEMIKPYGLRGSMLSILFMIAKTDVNQKAIASQLVLDQSTMSRDMVRLEKDGWIIRTRGLDARHTQLTLTNKGRTLLNEIAPKWAKLHEDMSAAIGAEQLKALDTIMNTLENLHHA